MLKNVLEIDRTIINQDFWSKSLPEKKKIVNKVLIDYTIAKMRELKMPVGKIENDGDYNKLLDMVEMVSDRLDGKSRDLFYAKYIKFIWEIVAHLQKRSIESKCEKSRYGSPVITQDSLGWQSITINKYSDSFVLVKEMIKEFNRRFNINNEIDVYQKKVK